jgi:hypothetical protein
MAQSLKERLAGLPPNEFSKHRAADKSMLEAVEHEYGFTFPDDFRDTILWSNGFGLSSHRTQLNVFRIEDLASHNMNEDFEEHLPDMFVIGSDGGGSIYYYDPNDRLGGGKFAIYLVPQDLLEFKDSIFVAHTLTEAVEAVLNNEYFFNRPKLGTQKS